MVDLPFGALIPADEHAVSVSLPRWSDVIEYEEKTPRALAHIRQGYPRFVYHPAVLALMAHIASEQGASGAWAWPSERVARQVADRMQSQKISCNVQPLYQGRAFATLNERSDIADGIIKQFWQHAGWMISSRLAQDLLKKEAPLQTEEMLLRARIANDANCTAADVFLYPSGMAAIFSAWELVVGAASTKRTIQLGFPYVDTLKIQQQFGTAHEYIPLHGDDPLAALEASLAREPAAAIFTEYPTNPLLQIVDLTRLREITRAYGCMLIIDDTLSSFYNIDLLHYADIVVSSLTKFFSGVGNVLAGALILSPQTPSYTALSSTLRTAYQPTLYVRDAEILLQNSQDFMQRMQRINANAQSLADALRTHPKIAQLYYPKFSAAGLYRKQAKQPTGFGGIISLTLQTPAQTQRFYDALPLHKGPSLGTNYTLVSAYTMLAHYQELEFAQKSLVSPYLLRVSVGLEDNLPDVFAKALAIV